ncbi:Alpha/Beta hydrolase protein [Halenospora varia]|nr:Alpha/Beta hydrolase protein [Halenospora varia]
MTSLAQTEMPTSYANLRPSLAKRLQYFVKVWGLKSVTTLGFAIVRFLKPPRPEIRPSLLKAYPCRPRLVNRIFIPRSHEPKELLPLYIDLHASGHVLLDAQFDDEYCATFANKFKVLVVSIEYAKAPLNKFPGPTNDVVAIAQAILEDESLPIDKSRVVLGGFSAGGNLSLSAAQMKPLQDKIRGVASFYPVADFSLSSAAKQESRPYRNPKDLDDLKDWGPIWNWAYIPPGHDLRDPLLSVRYAQPDTLPKWIYMVGAEYDMLADEARQTISDLACLDESKRDDSKYGFEKDTYKWTLVRDVRHGFTHDLMDNPAPDVVAMNKQRMEAMLEDFGKWLFKGPYAA